MEVSILIVCIDKYRLIRLYRIVYFVTNELIGIKPFYLYLDTKDIHLNPVFALLQWIDISEITQGYLFRRVNTNDQVILENHYLVGIGSFIMVVYNDHSLFPSLITSLILIDS